MVHIEQLAALAERGSVDRHFRVSLLLGGVVEKAVLLCPLEHFCAVSANHAGVEIQNKASEVVIQIEVGGVYQYGIEHSVFCVVISADITKVSADFIEHDDGIIV